MKSFAASLMLAAVIILASIGYTIYLDNVCEEMTILNERIEESVISEDFDKASDALDGLSEFMDSKKLALAATIDHTVIDNIERNMAELDAYISECQRYDAAAKCSVLKTLFKHLPKNYGLKLENIL